MIEDSTDHMRVQVEQAAIGCISGTGREWPHLLHALRHYGQKPRKEDYADTLRTMAQRVCFLQGWSAPVSTPASREEK